MTAWLDDDAVLVTDDGQISAAAMQELAASVQDVSADRAPQVSWSLPSGSTRRLCSATQAAMILGVVWVPPHETYLSVTAVLEFDAAELTGAESEDPCMVVALGTADTNGRYERIRFDESGRWSAVEVGDTSVTLTAPVSPSREGGWVVLLLWLQSIIGDETGSGTLGDASGSTGVELNVTSGVAPSGGANPGRVISFSRDESGKGSTDFGGRIYQVCYAEATSPVVVHTCPVYQPPSLSAPISTSWSAKAAGVLPLYACSIRFDAPVWTGPGQAAYYPDRELDQVTSALASEQVALQNRRQASWNSGVVWGNHSGAARPWFARYHAAVSSPEDPLDDTTWRNLGATLMGSQRPNRNGHRCIVGLVRQRNSPSGAVLPLDKSRLNLRLASVGTSGARIGDELSQDNIPHLRLHEGDELANSWLSLTCYQISVRDDWEFRGLLHDSADGQPGLHDYTQIVWLETQIGDPVGEDALDDEAVLRVQAVAPSSFAGAIDTYVLACGFAPRALDIEAL